MNAAPTNKDQSVGNAADHHQTRIWERPGQNLLFRFYVAIRYPDGYHGVYGMSYGGTAFDQFVGEATDSEPWPGTFKLGPSLGRELDKIPVHLRPAIAARMVESMSLPKAVGCRCGDLAATERNPLSNKDLGR